jgi:hypothetical protein
MYRLGRQPRKFDPRIPRLKTIFAGKPAEPPPTADWWTTKFPKDLGMMLNDQLGDCTCAAFYHIYQLWTGNADGTMVTEPDQYVQQLYEEACGYNPNDASSDQGGVEQDVLAYLLNAGAPTPQGPEKILGYVEIDQKNLIHLQSIIADCGAAYAGVNLPQSVLDNADDTTIPWDITGNTTDAGGHAIAICGYKDISTFYAVSWGKKYTLTGAFLKQYMDEAYGIVSARWVESIGLTPGGMTLAQLDEQMKDLKE